MASSSYPPDRLSVDDLPPLIVRVSGLPSDALAGFSSPSCLTAERRLCTLEERSQAARTALVQLLYTAIQDAPPGQRRLLLDLKRDSFNGRDLLGYRSHSQWNQVAQLLGPLAEYTLTAEEEVESCRRELLKVYECQRSREQQHLKELIRQPRLLRGLALGSPEFILNLPRFLNASPECVGRRERRLEMTSLRYVSRAAVKLSPFSSLTPIGVGRLQSTATSEESLRFGDDDWRESSRIYLQRFLIGQIADLLAHHGPFRAGLPVELNPTIERLDKGIYRFVCPGSWAGSPESPILERQQPSLVRARLNGPVPEWLLSTYKESSQLYRDVLAHLASEFPREPAEALRASVDRLLRIGFLCFELPWARPVGDSEALLLEYLDQIEDEALEPLRARLRGLIEALERYGESRSPAQTVIDGRAKIQEILEDASVLVGKRLKAEKEGKDWFFHEDVFLTSGGSTAEILKVPSARIQKVLDEMSSLVRLSNLGNSRLDYLHTLHGFAAARWPDAEEVGFLDFLEAAFPIFKQYISFDRETRLQWPLRRRAFNPMGLPEIDQLQLLREEAARALSETFVDKGPDVEVDLGVLRDIVGNLPEHYVEPRDFSVFVQPLQPSGASWVLNALVEGAGRFESRYTMVMPPEVRQEWSTRYSARSAFDPGSGNAEIVDLFSPANNNTANLHHPLTRRVIEFPGQPTGLAPEHVLPLRDLRVRFDGVGKLPWLVDPRGQRLLPSHLGAQGFRFLPSVYKFLALFGTWELRPCFPTKGWKQIGDVLARQRHWIGDVIYRRRAWVCELGPLKAEIAGQSGAAAFQKISRWRRQRELPDRVFIADPILIREGRSLLKPQYLDFTSCLFVDLFRTLLEKQIERLEVIEALPGPEDGLARTRGGRWATELQLDSHGLNPFELSSSHSGKNVVVASGLG
jgi:hypothetical protein